MCAVTVRVCAIGGITIQKGFEPSAGAPVR